jgi:putative transcriptional regulator
MQARAVTPVKLRLEQLRKANGWSQPELSRRSGVPQATIWRLEEGKQRSVDLDYLGKLAEALGVNATALIDHVPEPPAQPPKRTTKRRK